MKVLLYTEGLKHIKKSGLGKAIKHQIKALEYEKINYTLNPKDDYDLVHINFYGPHSYHLAKKAHKQGKKVIYHAHSTEEDFRNSFIGSNLFSPLFKKWLIKCYRLGDAIIAPTPYAKQLLEGYGLNQPIYPISNGLETKFFQKNEKDGISFRKEYGYQNNDIVIMGIGLYIERKGILDFVELAKRLPQYQFIWFGDSPIYASPKKIRKAIHTKIPNLKFPGYVEPDMIKKALSGANLYLFPTLEETEGIPALEALSCGQNLIVRDIPVFEDWLIDEVNCYKAKNLDEFERKINQIIKGELPCLKSEGYKVAKSRDLSNIGKKLRTVYESVLLEN